MHARAHALGPHLLQLKHHQTQILLREIDKIKDQVYQSLENNNNQIDGVIININNKNYVYTDLEKTISVNMLYKLNKQKNYDNIYNFYAFYFRFSSR